MIVLDDVSYSYDGRTPALDGVSLRIPDGEFLCILGGNGSGKSTLAKHLNALLVPDAGTVLVDGIDTSDPEYVYDVRARVGYVFQNPDDQLVATLVADDVAFGPENLGLDPALIGERCEESLDEVGLTGFGRREAHALSGGQKQRVAIAGVLAMHPEVLVLDEASSMLDPRGRAGLMRVCRELHGQGMTVVMITHDMEEAALADRVAVLHRGRIALEGAPLDVLPRASELAHLNLAVPPACRLSLALAERGIAVGPEVDEGALVDRLAQMAAHPAAGAGTGTGEGAGARPDARDLDPAVPRSQRDPGGAPAPGPRSDDGASAPGCADPAAGDAPCLRFDHVSYSYERSVRERARRRRLPRRGRRAAWGSDPDAVWALHNVDLAVRPGELLGLAGHTGSGKSTLIQHMNGLVHPTMGRVAAFGADLAGRRAAADAKTRVGLVLQYPEHQLFAQTVSEDVAFGPRNLGLPADEVGARVRAALDRVGLSVDELGDRSPFTLSGGQQRRVALAGVLAMRPEVLVLDEPAAGLDPAAHRAMLDLVARLHAQGLTVIMASHDMDDLAELCDRVAVLNEGSVLRLGSPAEVFSDGEALRRVGLGLPSAQRIACALARRGVPVRTDALHDIDGLADELAPILKGGAR